MRDFTPAKIGRLVGRRLARGARWASALPLSSALLAWLAFAATFAYLSAYVLIHYMGTDVATSMGYVANDGFCDLGNHEGVGVHCFGDFRYMLMFTDQANPWLDVNGYPNNYLPAGMIPHVVFGRVSQVSGQPLLGLYLYLLSMAVALVLPAWWATARRALWVRVAVVGLMALAAPPALMALERGNSVGFVVPPLLAVLIGVRADRRTLLMVGIVLAVMVKPQFVVLVAIYAVLRRWKSLGVALAWIAGTNAAAFAIWPRSLPTGPFDAVRAVLDYGSGAALGWTFPTNSSLAKGPFHLAHLLSGLPFSERGAAWITAHASLVGAVLVLGLVVSLVLLGRRVPPVISVIVLIMGSALLPGISWMYYLVFAIPVGAVILRDPRDEAPQTAQWRGVLDEANQWWLHRLAASSIAVAVALSLSRVFLPGSSVPDSAGSGPLVLTSVEFASSAWLVAAILVVIAYAWRATPVAPLSAGLKAS